MRRPAVAILAAALLLGACSSGGDDKVESGSGTGTGIENEKDGGGGEGDGGKGGETLPLDRMERCGDDQTLGCGGDPAPAGTTFTSDYGCHDWSIKYVGADVKRTDGPDSSNPLKVRVVTELEVSFKEQQVDYDCPSTADLSSVDDFDFVVVTQIADAESEDFRSMDSCGRDPETGSLKAGETLSIGYCNSISGPESLVGGDLRGEIEKSQGTESADIAIE